MHCVSDSSISDRNPVFCFVFTQDDITKKKIGKSIFLLNAAAL